MTLAAVSFFAFFMLSCVSVLAYDSSSGSSTIVIMATATDDAGSSSVAQTTLKVVSTPSNLTISQAKLLRDGETIYINDILSSTSSSDFNGIFYAQQRDRACGIGVIWSGQIERGEPVSISGILTTVNNERFIQAQSVTRSTQPL